LIYRLWERFTLYLPVALMAVLALISYWLVRTAPEDTAPEAVALYDNSPDYYLHSFSAQSFDIHGKVFRRIQGGIGRHFPDTKWTEIENFQGQSYGAGGDVLFAQAQRSLTNEEATEMQLMGSAQVLRPELQMAGQAPRPRAVYRSEFLHVFTDTGLAKSHLPVEVEYGRHRFRADSMVYDSVTHTLELKGRVKADFAPPPPKR
jgi:lipopolysaccharide export system protein LptC